MKKRKKNPHSIILSFLFLLLCSLLSCPSTTKAAGWEHGPVPFPYPQPSGKTSITLAQTSLELDWHEEYTAVKGFYRLINSTEKNIQLKMHLSSARLIPLPIPEISGEEGLPPEEQPLLRVHVDNEETKITHSAAQRRYSWILELKPQEEVELHFEYMVANLTVNNGSTVIGYSLPTPNPWAIENLESEITLSLAEIHPGQVNHIQPEGYTIEGQAIIWKFPAGTAHQDIIVSADVEGEKSAWEDILTDEERKAFRQLTTTDNYLIAAYFLAGKWEQLENKPKEALRVGQAYYLEKAGKQEEALKIWRELYDHETRFSRVYWSLGNIYHDQTSRINSYYNKVKELEIHPLLQEWLASELPANRTAPSEPEITVWDKIITGKNGIEIEALISDKDGDLKEIALSYHWEDSPEKEMVFSPEPFQYRFDPVCFVEAEGSLKRLYYEFTAVDKKGNSVSTGEKEAFFLNDKIPCETVPFPGATLVYADYDADEYEKIRKWFSSYLKMAKETGFIPIEAKSPYFIFMGKPHAFADEYQGSLFIIYTPSPFNPKDHITKVHRYFLSYWYGSGWKEVPEKRLEILGNALLLGKGPYRLCLEYLKEKDDKKFASLLCLIGEGREWDAAVFDLYGLSGAKLWSHTFWFAFGNYVIAFFLIIAFAWLGKNGHLARMIHYAKNRSSNR